MESSLLPRPLSSASPPPSKSATPSARHIIFVDDNLHGEISVTTKVLTVMNPQIAVKQVTSLHELIVWLAVNADLVAQPDHVRVVTNRYRERDGGGDAAERLIKSLRADAKVKHLKILVYCGNPREMEHVEEKHMYDRAFCDLQPRLGSCDLLGPWSQVTQWSCLTLRHFEPSAVSCNR